VDDRDLMIRCLDMTSLRGDEADPDVLALCERAAEHPTPLAA